MPTKEELELETLKRNSPYALPSDTAASGWTSAQVKEKFYAGLLYLYNLFKEHRTGVDGDVAEMSDKVDEFSELVNDFVTAGKAVMDDDGNVIKSTYAKIADILNGNIGVLKYMKSDSSKENISAIEPRLMALIVILQGYFSNGKANSAAVADKATADGNGQNIVNTYETKTNVAALQTAIGKILDGTSVVGKALKDGSGNSIESTYETKSDASSKVARSNLVSIIDEATNSLSGLMSAQDKARLDALYALLSSDDSDTVVNTIAEVLAVLDQYPEGVTLTNALALKVAFSDVINNLTSNEISKPLSAYQGKVLNEKFEGLDEEIDGKIQRGAGERDGTLISGKADAADNLTPYSDESGSEQSKPFTAQGTATDNGTAEVTVGSFAQLKEKQGNTVAWNQFVAAAKKSYTNADTDTRAVIDLYAMVLSNGNYAGLLDLTTSQYVLTTGFKTYIGVVPSGVSGDAIVLKHNGETHDLFMSQTSTGFFCHAGDVILITFNALGVDPTTSGGVNLDDICIISLTQLCVLWAIQYATLHPEYNAGSLINGDGAKLVCTGRQLWDEEWRNGAYDSQTGEYLTDTNVCNENQIKVLPNQEYYFKGASISSYGSPAIYFYDADGNYLGFYPFPHYTQSGEFTTPTNCSFINFVLPSAYGTTYNHDITISLRYASGQDYDEYFPYEEPKVYDTGNEVLRSAGSVRDSKKPDGTITRRVGTVDLGDMDWTYGGTIEGGVYRMSSSSVSSLIKSNDDPSVVANIRCSKYVSLSANATYLKNIGISVDNANVIVYDPNYQDPSAFKTAMSGVYLNYELAEPTTEQGTPFPENIAVNDYGMMTWLKADGTYAEIPQGALFFYPADYKGMLDDIYYRCTPSGNASDLVVQSELSASETARDAVDAQLKEALGGTLRQCLCLRDSVSFENTECVDVDSLSLTISSTDIFVATIGNSSTTRNHAMQTKYRQVTSFADMESTDKSFYKADTQQFYFHDSTYATVDAFKAGNKGVLLAYEKA